MGPERFSAATRALVVAPDTELFLSAVSAWEISIKYALGKLSLPAKPGELVPSLMAQTAVTSLPILHSHALHVGELPSHHRDPFDRMLIAQAQVERLPILTADPRFSAYEVEVLRA